MPADFENCIKEGGKVVTLKLGKNKYVHACKTKAGKWTKGEVKTKQKETK